MDESAAGAEALRQAFNDIGHPAETDGDMLSVPHWGLRVRMRLNNVKQASGETRLTYQALSYLDRLAHPAEDYELGWGPTLRDASRAAAQMYMGSVFPVIHSICCTNECGCGVENTPLFAADDETGMVRDWRLIRGPQYMLNGTPDDIPRDTFRSLLEDEFPALIRRPGTYWFKCFAGRMGESVQSDCFVNGQINAHGKQRLAEYAQGLPRERNLLTCKQHLLLYPIDPEVVDEYRSRRRALWLDTVVESGASVRSDDLDTVLDGFEAFHDCDGLDEPLIRKRLEDRGMSAETARNLVSFLPAACARDGWRDRGIPFATEYTLLNFKTGRSVNRPLNAEPLFETAATVVRAWRDADVVAELRASVLSFSAEHNALLSGLQQNATPTRLWLLVPTDDDVEGEIDDKLLKALGIQRRKQWWKFW